MSTILGISGSLRRGSYNTALLKAAQLAQGGAKVEIATIEGIPLYNGDEEAANGIPASVEALKQRIIAASGLLLVTPEYNNSIPGVMKNAVDWLSRPPADIPKVFAGLPVAVIGATPGGFGTLLAQNAWLPVLRTLGTRPWFGGRLVVSRADRVFNEEGELVDERLREQLGGFVRGFAEFIERARRARESG